MYLPLTLIALSTVSWATPLPVLDNRQTAVAVPITSQIPTSVIQSEFEKRQPIYAPVETYKPVLEVIAENTPNALEERASGAGDDFDSLLSVICATLKTLKSLYPSSFTSLLQSCNQMTNSSPPRRTRTLKERDPVDIEQDVVDDVEAAEIRSTEVVLLGRSNSDLSEKRDFDIDNIVEERRDEDFDSLL